MGTKVAPTYATLVMGFLEEKMYSQLPEILDENSVQYISRNWKRYLDDCFIFWTQGKEKLHTFHNLLNNLHESIKFTMEYNENELPFLDVLIIKKGDEITTDIFCKETDTHQYLDFKSCHPAHTKRNIPFNLARRICSIVSDTGTRSKRMDELRCYLRRQHYPDNLINAGIKKALDIPRSELRKTQQKPDDLNRKIPLVVTHNPRNHNILKTAKRFFPILEQSENLRTLFNTSDIINSRRQAPNLKRILTTAKFISQKETKRISKCGDPRCGTCEYIEEGENIILKTGRKIIPNANMNCKSENLIYCAICPTCKEFYIGQTGRLIARVRVHKQQIRDASVRNTPCCQHFAECGKGKFKIFPFYKMWNEDEIPRLSKEDFFIKLLNPKLNYK